ncbi:cobalt transporter [Mesorhizobium sp. M1C.F.Ca.ET.193.01.1.1]|uniref:CbtA family protein n=1 Tax=unclassified Mesorhizobium TaxID=325217 RepID=UPI000FD57BDF|nr:MULTISPECIES: CbtA family protein [unclassified Mesorhizobium]TGS93509.1 cobalt transporter [bacterium M00.F.Ca.ET.177.01.1.1]TGQ50802.1 cobalt transporter [Mesorhizobium sp. M1C.F.Ca.ET.210.01.1.1]TGQ65965.1 cobalt transporter [Mesorhizobium sp. M1C.F.Ca.ET.212.01.1.1]TGR00019.1 cobalt transporter [Mesorhizobium sp. M1C.F.Ca.ET.204.01.1.1]TGR20495.1 cobalt transporter [Mesorhizobium sp. M1C.F.Ca.ET.196.01.1.1]
MNLFRNVVFVAAIAGLVAGVALACMQAYATVPLILKAEVYEKAGDGHHHDHATGANNNAMSSAAPADNAMSSAAPAPAEAAAPVEDEGWAPADGFERFAFNVVANIVTGIGFALILVAVSEFAGGIGNWRQGVFWGLAGFAVFTLAPGLGLPPELPAMPAAELLPRQVWWFSTVAATATGLGLIAFRRSLPLAILGVALIVAPHIVGAPQPDSFETAIPEGLHHQFVVAVTLTDLVFWLVLGVVVGVVRGRFTGTATSLRGSFA